MPTVSVQLTIKRKILQSVGYVFKIVCSRARRVSFLDNESAEDKLADDSTYCPQDCELNGVRPPTEETCRSSRGTKSHLLGHIERLLEEEALEVPRSLFGRV